MFFTTWLVPCVLEFCISGSRWSRPPCGVSDLHCVESETHKKWTTGFVYSCCKGFHIIEMRRAVCRYHVDCWGWIFAYGICSVAQEGTRISLLLTLGTVKSVEKPRVFMDTQRAIKISENDTAGYGTKQIGLRYHSICDVQSGKKFNLNHCPYNDMVAGMLTKSFGKLSF